MEDTSARKSVYLVMLPRTCQEQATSGVPLPENADGCSQWGGDVVGLAQVVSEEGTAPSSRATLLVPLIAGNRLAADDFIVDAAYGVCYLLFPSLVAEVLVLRTVCARSHWTALAGPITTLLSGLYRLLK